jgi:hypothetical protein
MLAFTKVADAFSTAILMVALRTIAGISVPENASE